MIVRLSVIIAAVFVLTSCTKNGNDDWENIDYAKIAHDNYQRENDQAYTPPPSVIGCVDDDLYNCKSR